MLRRREKPKAPLNWRFQQMNLSMDKAARIYDEFLTLEGIPTETFEYRLLNRSVLAWAIDRSRVRTAKRSGITPTTRSARTVPNTPTAASAKSPSCAWKW